MISKFSKIICLLNFFLNGMPWLRSISPIVYFSANILSDIKYPQRFLWLISTEGVLVGNDDRTQDWHCAFKQDVADRRV